MPHSHCFHPLPQIPGASGCCKGGCKVTLLTHSSTMEHESKSHGYGAACNTKMHTAAYTNLEGVLEACAKRTAEVLACKHPETSTEYYASNGQSSVRTSCDSCGIVLEDAPSRIRMP